MGIAKYLLTPALYRKKKIFFSVKRQHRVAVAWNPVIDAYFEGRIKKYSFRPKKVLSENKKIIWQYWGQGTDNDSLPEIVKICFDSVDKYAGEEYNIIRLSDDTITDYIDVPDFVLKKKAEGKFKIAFFSDLLRLMLLQAYGGIWLDATVLLTGRLPQEYTHMDYFVFQRSASQEQKDYWVNADANYFSWRADFKVRMLNSIIFAQSHSELIGTLLDIMLYIWKHSQKISYYYTFQVIYNELITRKLAHLQCPVASDCTPHIIQKKLRLGYSYLSFAEAVALTPMHKMTYYNEKELSLLKENL